MFSFRHPEAWEPTMEERLPDTGPPGFLKTVYATGLSQSWPTISQLLALTLGSLESETGQSCPRAGSLDSVGV